MLNPTPREKLLDAQGRPYFLWDCDLTLEEFQEGLKNVNPDVRAYLVGKLMRQAKPGDVFTFVSPRDIRELWPKIERYLGRSRPFWTWLFSIVDLVADPSEVLETPLAGPPGAGRGPRKSTS